MLLTYLKQLEKRVSSGVVKKCSRQALLYKRSERQNFRKLLHAYSVLSLLLIALTGQSVYAAGQSSNTDYIKHAASSGGKGNDVVTLKKPDKVKAGECVAFVDASVEYSKRRFGKASIAKAPAKGCDPAKKACKLTVSWSHAPAGLLNYRLKVNWDVKSSGC